MHFVSCAAREVIVSGRSSIDLVKDHAVPCKVLKEELASAALQANWGVDEVENFLDARYRLGIITKAEDGELSKKFKQELPSGRADPFARYELVGIIGTESPTPSASEFGDLEFCGPRYKCVVCSNDCVQERNSAFF
jgi:hypothetical protein